MKLSYEDKIEIYRYDNPVGHGLKSVKHLILVSITFNTWSALLIYTDWKVFVKGKIGIILLN